MKYIHNDLFRHQAYRWYTQEHEAAHRMLIDCSKLGRFDASSAQLLYLWKFFIWRLLSMNFTTSFLKLIKRYSRLDNNPFSLTLKFALRLFVKDLVRWPLALASEEPLILPWTSSWRPRGSEINPVFFYKINIGGWPSLTAAISDPFFSGCIRSDDIPKTIFSFKTIRM